MDEADHPIADARDGEGDAAVVVGAPGPALNLAAVAVYGGDGLMGEGLALEEDLDDELAAGGDAIRVCLGDDLELLADGLG